MIEPKAILHFTIGVTDLDRATAFYQDIVGATLVRQNRRHTMSFMDAGGDLFVLTVCGPDSSLTAWMLIWVSLLPNRWVSASPMGPALSLSVIK